MSVGAMLTYVSDAFLSETGIDTGLGTTEYPLSVASLLNFSTLFPIKYEYLQYQDSGLANNVMKVTRYFFCILLVLFQIVNFTSYIVKSFWKVAKRSFSFII